VSILEALTRYNYRIQCGRVLKRCADDGKVVESGARIWRSVSNVVCSRGSSLINVLKRAIEISTKVSHSGCRLNFYIAYLIIQNHNVSETVRILD